MNVIGQPKLLSIIDTYYKLEFLPKTLMFIGPHGCGKHTIAQYISKKFELDLKEIEDNVSSADLDEFLYSTIDTLYLIDLNKFSEKQQNQFLKFIEEPSKSVYVILITNSEAGVLNTILNRSIKLHFEEYTKEQVEQITNTSISDLAFAMFRTPGKLISLTEASLADIVKLANKVVFDLKHTDYAKSLAISTCINYKDLYNKIDFNLFFDAVEFIAFEDYKNNKNPDSLVIFNITNKFKQRSTQQNLIKETLILSYLTELWEALKV